MRLGPGNIIPDFVVKQIDLDTFKPFRDWVQTGAQPGNLSAAPTPPTYLPLL